MKLLGKIASWFRRVEEVQGGAVSGTFHEGAWLTSAAVLHKEAALSGEAALSADAWVSGRDEVTGETLVGVGCWTGTVRELREKIDATWVSGEEER